MTHPEAPIHPVTASDLLGHLEALSFEELECDLYLVGVAECLLSPCSVRLRVLPRHGGGRAIVALQFDDIMRNQIG